MKSKLLILLSLFAFVGGAKAQNWTWTGETNLANNATYYFHNKTENKFIQKENTVLSDNVDNAVLITLLGSGTSYQLRQEGNKYISWGVTDLDGLGVSDNNGNAIVFTKQNSSNADCYRLTYTRRIFVNVTAALYTDGNGNLVKAQHNDRETGLWQLISTAQKSQYKKFLEAWNNANDFKNGEHFAHLTDALKKRLNNALEASAKYEASASETTNSYTKELTDALTACNEYDTNDYHYEFPLTVTEVGYATICLDHDMVAPTGVHLFTVKYDKNTNVAIETEWNGVVPKETGFVVEAAAGTYTFTRNHSGAAKAVKDNDLVGVLEDSKPVADAEHTIYVFNKVNDKPGFYKWSGNKAIGAHKAYLLANVTTTPGVKEFLSIGDDYTDAIGNVEATEKDATIFDIMGRKLNNIPAHGMYIKNGKKYMVK